MRAIASARRFLVFLAAMLAAGCGSGTDGGGSFTFTLSEPAASVAQGAGKAVTITITRSDFDRPITFTAEGLPTGVTATFSPTPASGTSTILQLTAAATAPAGGGTITVRGTGEGAADQTVSLALTVTVTGSFTLGVLSSAVTVAQGGGDRTSILVERFGGFAGAVGVAVTGAPAGLTATVEPSSTGGNSVLLTLAASASLATGSHTLTATGTSSGVSSQQTALTVNVVAAPATTGLTMTFCTGAVPAWFAYKNEGFSWQVVAPTGTAFAFQATDRLAVAMTFVSANQAVKQTSVFFGSRSEFAYSTGRDCPGTMAVSGSVAGLSSAQQARIVMGNFAQTATPASPAFSFTTLPERALDLVATQGISTSGSFTPEKMIIRRSQNPASGAPLPALDFASAEAFVPQQNSVTINNVTTSDAKVVVNTLWSATTSYGAIQVASPSSGSVVFFSVPAAQLVSGDVHELFIDAYQASALLGRTLRSYFAAPAERTESVGPFVNVPVVSALASSPYVRLRGRLDSQPEYSSAAQIHFVQQLSAGDVRVVVLHASSAYHGSTPAIWDLVTPDFNGVSGFSNSWMPTPGQPTEVTVLAFGGRSELLHDALPVPGDLLRYSDRTSVISGANLRAERERRHFEPGQYFRR